MTYKKVNYLPLIFLPVIIILCFGLWAVDKDPVPWVAVESADGVFDLRDFDFSNAFAAPKQNVEYIPGELLTPEEFAARDDIRTGEVPRETEAVTMRARYLVPDNINYGIVGYSVNYASTVYINGKWIFDAGRPALTLHDEQATEAYRLFSAQPVDGVIEIVIQTSTFATIDPNSVMDWYIGKYDLARVYYARLIAADIIVMSWYILLALISLLLFLVLPSYKANCWLALLALLWAVRVGLKTRKILLTLFPCHTWDFVYKAEIITSPLTIILLVLVLHSVFTGALPKWLRIAIIGGSAIASLAVVFLPWPVFLGHSVWSNPVIYLSLAVMLLFILISMQRRRVKPDVSQIIILAGMCMVVLAFMWDEHYFANRGLPFAMTQSMMLAFTMFMFVSAMLETMQKTVWREVQLAQKVKTQENELLETRIDIMLSQIQPHFLYNTLNTIENLCYKDSGQAARLVRDFSEYLRENMDSLTQKNLVPFNRELEHIKIYLDIEKLRFEERLNIVYDLRVTDFKLPILTVQPLVENAVRFGVTKRLSGGTVTIATRSVPQGVEITVSDDGAGFDPSQQPNLDDRSHIGMENVRERLHSQCAGSLTVESEKGKGTVCTIIIPTKGDDKIESDYR